MSGAHSLTPGPWSPALTPRTHHLSRQTWRPLRTLRKTGHMWWVRAQGLEGRDAVPLQGLGAHSPQGPKSRWGRAIPRVQ